MKPIHAPLLLVLSFLFACGDSESASDTASNSEADSEVQVAEEGVASPESKGSMDVEFDGKKMVSVEPEMIQFGRWGANEDMLHLVVRGHVDGDFGYQVGGPTLEFIIYLRPAEAGSHKFLRQVSNTSNDLAGVSLQVTGPDLPVLHGKSDQGALNVTACELEGDTNDTLVVKRFAATFDGTFKHGDPYADGPTSQVTGSIDYTR